MDSRLNCRRERLNDEDSVESLRAVQKTPLILLNFGSGKTVRVCVLDLFFWIWEFDL